jgi:hypothetical protein
MPMSKAALISWILTGLFALAAIIAAIAQPTHWKRTVALAVVLAVVAAAVAVTRPRPVTGA